MLNLSQANSRQKRKKVVEDSDEELGSNDASAYKRTSGRSKKARMAAVFSDEDVDEDEAPKLNSFAKRLTRYQKSPAKSKSRGTLNPATCA